MTTDPTVAVAPPTDTIPAPLTLQQRHEKAAAALALVREPQSDTTTHGDFATFRGGRWYAALEAAFTAIHTAAYYAEYAVTMDQVEARA
jgi:hypothetical protein